MTDFAHRAREAMQAQGVSMRHAARELKYDPGYLSRVLNGKQRPSQQLADALDALVGADGALSALASTLTPDDRARVAHSISTPSRVDAGTVAALADVLAAQRRLEDVIGPTAMVPATTAQLATITKLAREARGPYRHALARVAAEWTQFAGWLHAAVRRDRDAIALFSQAEEFADDAGDATMAATAVSFRGYVAWQQGRYSAMLRAAQGSLHTPGAHVAQLTFDTLQAAQAFGALEEGDRARRLLDQAAVLTEETERQRDTAHPWHYYYTRSFFLLQVGIAHLNLGDYADAVDHLTAALDGLPDDQRDAAWTGEYRTALEQAKSAA